MPTPVLTLGAKLLRDALARYPSQEALAAELEVTQQSVSGWIAGGPIPRLKSLARIKAVLGIGLDAWTVPLEAPPKRAKVAATKRPPRRRSGISRAVTPATRTGTEG